jgi:hypothetical protein
MTRLDHSRGAHSLATSPDNQQVTSSVVTPTAELPRRPVTEETVAALVAVGASGEVVDLARELARR